MSRAWDVTFGVLLIATIWLWCFSGAPKPTADWWTIFTIFGRVSMACFITAPVYREYLR